MTLRRGGLTLLAVASMALGALASLTPGEVLAAPPNEPPVTVVVTLADDSPAASAMVVLIASLEDSPMWGAVCDDQGRIEVPREASTRWIAVRHPESSFLLEPWSPPAPGQALSLQLPAATPILFVRVQDAAGKPAPRAHVVLWLGSTRLGEAMLAWLTRTPGRCDASGYWRAVGVPPHDVAVLAVDARATHEQVLAHTQIEGRRAQVRYPWPAEVNLTAVAP